MANYGKYYVAVRLLLLKRYLEANAGRNRTVSRKELEDLLRDNEMPIKNPKTLYADLAALGDFGSVLFLPLSEGGKGGYPLHMGM